MTLRALTADDCRRTIDPRELRFESTEDVAPLSGIGAQERAIQALQFGLDIQQARFHVVVVGAAGTGRTFVARSVAKAVAMRRPTPDDVLLLPNPKRPSEPSTLSLPAGDGRAFAAAMQELHAKLVESIRGVADGERFKQARAKVRRRVTTEEAALEEVLRAAATAAGLVLTRTDNEVQLASENEGENPSPEALSAVAGSVDEFEAKLAAVHEEAEAELRGLMKQLLGQSVKACFAPVAQRYEGRLEIVSFLSEVENVVVKELELNIDEPSEEPPTLARGLVVPTVLTEHSPGSGAPVVEVPYPTLGALFGRTHAPPEADFPPEPGFAVAGAIHQANGGFLILPAAALLKNESLYEQLKACLLAEKFIIPEHNPSYYRGTSEELLFPSIALDLKVVLVASPSLFQELHEVDPEFSQLFKVQARFESTLSYEQGLVTYPQFLAGLTRDKGLVALTPEAVAELLSWGSRLAESQSRVTAQIGLIAEVATEAGYRAERVGKKIVDGPEVRAALDASRRRAGYFRDELHDLLARGIIQVDVTGRRTGQINAISVISDGPLSFGRPCRVTASVSPGFDGPIDIAREVAMGGPIHAKGVLILAGLMAARFGQRRPVSFRASVVFEQTYESIDGDSASLAELLSIVSSLSGVPLRQDLAVTGAIDQLGAVQAVGGINEKIEAFYDVCVAKGLTGTQGVLIPETCRDALVLRSDVVEAVRAGRFHVHTGAWIEDATELLTGVPAGTLDAHGEYPRGTVFHEVSERLGAYYRTMLELSRGA